MEISVYSKIANFEIWIANAIGKSNFKIAVYIYKMQLEWLGDSQVDTFQMQLENAISDVPSQGNCIFKSGGITEPIGQWM